MNHADKFIAKTVVSSEHVSDLTTQVTALLISTASTPDCNVAYELGKEAAKNYGDEPAKDASTLVQIAGELIEGAA